MKIGISVDVGSICVGIVIGLIIAPHIYQPKKMKRAATKGAVKEVANETKKGLFGRKD